MAPKIHEAPDRDVKYTKAIRRIDESFNNSREFDTTKDEFYNAGITVVEGFVDGSIGITVENLVAPPQN